MKRMTLWHPTKSGRIVQVDVAWPRSWWIKDAINGLPRSTATLAEVEASRGRIERDEAAASKARVEALYASRPTESSPMIEHSRYIAALSDEMQEDHSGNPAFHATFVLTERLAMIYRDAIDTAKRARDQQGWRARE